MFYDKSPPPEPGSVSEAVHMAVFEMRQRIRHLEMSMLVSDDPEAKQQLYEEYVDAIFPHLAGQKGIFDNPHELIDKFITGKSIVLDRGNNE